MVEYGPFIEYCCELYIHHTVLNIIAAAMIILCFVTTLGVAWYVHRISKK